MDEYSDSLVRLDRHPTRAALRSFGIALALLCFARTLTWYTHSVGQPAWSALAGVSAVAVAGWRPNVLRGLYVLLGVLSYPLRWLTAFSILALLYFAVIAPVALLFRLTRRSQADALQSSWHEVKARADKANYFRQF
jgi:Saxitoxin biosynthesis operon protein SxtJ